MFLMIGRHNEIQDLPTVPVVRETPVPHTSPFPTVGDYVHGRGQFTPAKQKIRRPASGVCEARLAGGEGPTLFIERSGIQDESIVGRSRRSASVLFQGRPRIV